MTDPNNAQPSRHRVIKRTIGGSLARSWPPPLPRRRRCCVLQLLLSGLSAAAANNRCAVVDSAVCRVLRLSFILRVCAPRALAYAYEQLPRHGIIKRTKRRSLAPDCPRYRAATAAACCCYCCWACVLLLLPIIVVLLLLLLCANVDTFVYSVCACSRTYFPRVS